ncbi:hypothetical protein SAMN05216591_0651 [Pseudomonas extremaustralis]|uniref:Uncharacterized protein n=1 Tax=Pseudomonas extremaustralis TaxID=359110 RepID=A0ABY0MZI5_9PSED|nr:hypothetical protein SAMN05216591_0651 [Pseudomonas extremaustralis]
MTEKSVEQMARDTLNAIIASGQLPEKLVYSQGNRLELDTISLRQIENQLLDYYAGPKQPSRHKMKDLL